MKKKIILLISGKGTNAINITNYFQNNKICLFGPGIDKLRSSLHNKNITYLNNDYPSSKNLGLIAEIKFQNKDFVHSAYFEPTYLKPFIAN